MIFDLGNGCGNASTDRKSQIQSWKLEIWMSDVLNQLYATIESRKTNAPPASYTAKLFAAGENEIIKKVGEEAIEVIVAAKESILFFIA